MPRTFSHDVSHAIGDNGDEIVATIEFTATPIVPARTYGPPEDCYPAEGGEVEVLKVVDLFVPEVKARPGTALSIPRRTLFCPEWLADMILANVDKDELFQAADFSDQREYERD